jgi:hypothetical protein
MLKCRSIDRILAGLWAEIAVDWSRMQVSALAAEVQDFIVSGVWPLH